MENKFESEKDKVYELENRYKSIGEKNSQTAIDTYLNWYSTALLYLNAFYSENNPDFAEFKKLNNSGNGYCMYKNFCNIYPKYRLLMQSESTQGSGISQNGIRKKPMVFISHSHKDKDFVEALVDLLEAIGLTEQTLFCSSVQGYGVQLSANIFDTLRNLFQRHDIFVVFIHSPRYYESTVSLNEMGAAWVLKADFCSILTKDMEFDKMNGVVKADDISIKVDSDNAQALLNELYNRLIAKFSLNKMSTTKWERKRDKFLQTVNNISSSKQLMDYPQLLL